MIKAAAALAIGCSSSYFNSDCGTGDNQRLDTSVWTSEGERFS